MAGDNVSQSLNKQRTSVQGLCAADNLGSLAFFNQLNVKLVECFNVVRGKRNWHENDSLDVWVCFEGGDGSVGFRAKPGLRADLRLPGQAIGV